MYIYGQVFVSQSPSFFCMVCEKQEPDWTFVCIFMKDCEMVVFSYTLVLIDKQFLFLLLMAASPPNTPADKNLIADATWARDVTAYFLRLQAVVVYFSRIQRNTIRCKQRLVYVEIFSHCEALIMLHYKFST